MKLTKVEHDPFRVARAPGGRILPSNINHNPTEMQKEAGNYAKDHVRIHGLDITVENAKGKQRTGVGRNGKPWSVTMPAHYGYFKRTEGKDGEHIDCYIGDYPESRHVYVVNQVDADSGRFDEHKCMLGFRSKEEASAIYKRVFSDGRGGDRMGHVTETDIDTFKRWLNHADKDRQFIRNTKRNRAAGGFASGGRVRLTKVEHDPFETHKAIGRALHAHRASKARDNPRW